MEEKIEGGEPVEDIRRKLSDAGWNDEEIARAIRQVRTGRREQPPAPGPRKNGDGTEPWKGRLRLIVLFLVSAIIGFLTVATVPTFL